MTGETSSASGPLTRSATKQLFTDSALAAGIKDTTLAKLEAEDFDTLEAIQALEDEDTVDLDITKGQLRLLLKWRQSLRQSTDKQTVNQTSTASQPVSTDNQATPMVNTQTLSRDQELQNLLNSMKETLPGNQLWTNSDKAPLQEVRSTWDEAKTQGKPLFITDFISNVSSGSLATDEQEVVKQGSSQLIFRSNRIRPAVEQVSLGQWISANARIMSKLITDGKLSTQQQVLEYLQYTADFGDYSQTCELPSLMVYDQEYRRKQAITDRAWGADDVHLCTFYLHRRQRPEQRTQQTSKFRHTRKHPRILDNNGIEICRNFNISACFKDNCIYSHACLICKDKSHPKTRHPPPSH